MQKAIKKQHNLNKKKPVYKILKIKNIEKSVFLCTNKIIIGLNLQF